MIKKGIGAFEESVVIEYRRCRVGGDDEGGRNPPFGLMLEWALKEREITLRSKSAWRGRGDSLV